MHSYPKYRGWDLCSVTIPGWVDVHVYYFRIDINCTNRAVPVYFAAPFRTALILITVNPELISASATCILQLPRKGNYSFLKVSIYCYRTKKTRYS